ncbi:MAG: HAD-IA family hydrolase [Candidatus Paceibacterota bacterium]|jgi:putative hydrolase of the HAD superfamily
MIKAVILDLNGIFLQSPKLSERVEKDFGVEGEIFKSKLREAMHKMRQPDAGPAWRHLGPFLKDLKINFTENDFWNYWFEGEEISERMFTYTAELRSRGIKVFILSNNFRERIFHNNRYKLIEEAVDKVYYSWQTGFIKPDVRAWQHILKEHNLTPPECLYFDDQEKNAKAAESIGIKSFVFTNESELERIVNEALR